MTYMYGPAVIPVVVSFTDTLSETVPADVGVPPTVNVPPADDVLKPSDWPVTVQL